jgi:hypothetical protein
MIPGEIIDRLSLTVEAASSIVARKNEKACVAVKSAVAIWK